jgi:beta-glucanase (GH16 family)
MIKTASLTTAILFFANLAYSQVPSIPGWKLVWSDEFNYVEHPDPSKWGYEEEYVRHNELQYYTVNRLENARVEGGNLLIELRKETPESFLPTSINDEWHRYTSASVNTRNTASWTYDRFEIRAKMHEGKGSWPAMGSSARSEHRTSSFAKTRADRF